MGMNMTKPLSKFVQEMIDAGIPKSLLTGIENAEKEPLTYKQLYDVAQYLYQLLKDIDDADEISQWNNGEYRILAQSAQMRKALVVYSASATGIVKFKALES
jgi:hypothetical protein